MFVYVPENIDVVYSIGKVKLDALAAALSWCTISGEASILTS